MAKAKKHSEYPMIYERTPDGCIRITRTKLEELTKNARIGSHNGIYFERGPNGQPNGVVAFVVNGPEEEAVLLEQFNPEQEVAA